MRAEINWIDENTAAAKLGYKPLSLRLFTRNEKRRKLPIRTKKLNHRTILYSMVDIDNYINNAS